MADEWLSERAVEVARLREAADALAVEAERALDLPEPPARDLQAAVQHYRAAAKEFDDA